MSPLMSLLTALVEREVGVLLKVQWRGAGQVMRGCEVCWGEAGG